jgi:hypothetical protein
MIFQKGDRLKVYGWISRGRYCDGQDALFIRYSDPDVGIFVEISGKENLVHPNQCQKVIDNRDVWLLRMPSGEFYYIACWSEVQAKTALRNITDHPHKWGIVKFTEVKGA